MSGERLSDFRCICWHVPDLDQTRTSHLKPYLHGICAMHKEYAVTLVEVSAAAMRALPRSPAYPKPYVHGVRAVLKDCGAACAAVSAATVCTPPRSHANPET